jgi:uncharacterized protein YdhG (YjbR/CyaY superfamily)
MTSQGLTVDDYIHGFPPEARELLGQVRALIRAGAPEATERISYGIPTFDLGGRYLLYLGGFKQHVSVYPVTAGMTRELGDALKPYQKGKGTLQFEFGRPVPEELIRRIVQIRVGELTRG